MTDSLLETIAKFIRSVLGLREYCVLQRYRSVLNEAYGSSKFAEVVGSYWTRGYGTTCAVTLNWALSQCGIDESNLNRGKTFIPGNHLAPLLRLAKMKGALEENPDPKNFRPGDIFKIEKEGSPADWHVGIVERNDYPVSITTLDGGQSDSRGEQAIKRVVRPYLGNLIGPSPRKATHRIVTAKLF